MSFRGDSAARASKHRLLQEWAGFISSAARQGQLSGKPIQITRVEGVAGPRAGALEMLAGLDSGRLLQALGKNDAAALRQFVPWHFTGEPQAFMSGRFVRVEAGWSNGLAETMVRLTDLGRHPQNDGRWVAGKNEYGATVIAGLNDRTPHYLISGATGSGKSVALRSALLQLSRDPLNKLVLIDGKYGESLKQVEHLPGVVGPVAVDGPTVQAALGWTCQEMRKRYENGNARGRVIVVFDEIQEFMDDSTIAGLMKKIAGQGRAAHVHLMAATQHPTVASFGDATTRRNLTGRMALRVGDCDASRVAVGGKTPRADYLLGCGDCYTVAPGVVHRVQLAYVGQREIDAAGNGDHRFESWPEYRPESVGQDLPSLQVNWSYSGGEIAVSLLSAEAGEGRPALVSRLEGAGFGRPGVERAMRLLQLGREAHAWLDEHLYYIGQ